MGDELFTKWPAGTLVEDTGKVGIISKVLPYGALDTEISAIKWRKNYEITYVDGDIQIIAETTFVKLVRRGDIKIINSD